MKCKTCGKKYHWCSSCGISSFEDELLADSWCSMECWKNSEEFNKIKQDLLQVIAACDTLGASRALDDLMEENEDKCYFIYGLIKKSKDDICAV